MLKHTHALAHISFYYYAHGKFAEDEEEKKIVFAIQLNGHLHK